MAQNKKVGDQSKIVGKAPETNKKVEETKVMDQEEMISRVVAHTTSTIMQELMPHLTKGNEQKTRDTVQRVNQRVVREMNTEFEEVVQANKEYMRKIAQAPKKDFRIISIPQVYRKYFGPTLPVGINGSFVTVPVDGRPHRVHKDFYSIIKRKLDYEDNKISYMEQTNFSDTLEVPDRDTLGQ